MSDAADQRETVRQYRLWKLRRNDTNAFNGSLRTQEVHPAFTVMNLCATVPKLVQIATCAQNSWNFALSFEKNLASRLSQCQVKELHEALDESQASFSAAASSFDNFDSPSPDALTEILQALNRALVTEEYLIRMIQQVEVQAHLINYKGETFTGGMAIHHRPYTLHSLECLVGVYAYQIRFLVASIEANINVDADSKNLAIFVDSYILSRAANWLGMGSKAVDMLNVRCSNLPNTVISPAENEAQRKARNPVITDLWLSWTREWRKDQDGCEKTGELAYEVSLEEPPTPMKLARQTAEYLGFLTEISKTLQLVTRFGFHVEDHVLSSVGETKLDDLLHLHESLQAANSNLANNVQLLVKDSQSARQTLKDFLKEIAKLNEDTERRLTDVLKSSGKAYQRHRMNNTEATSSSHISCFRLAEEALLFMGRELSYNEWICERLRVFLNDKNPAEALLAFDFKLNQELRAVYTLLEVISDKRKQYHHALLEVEKLKRQ